MTTTNTARPKVELQKGFMVDGRVFATKALAEEYLRGPEVLEALGKLAGNADSAQWLFDNEAAIMATYKAGKIRRVSSKERKELEDALAKIESGFLAVHRDAILSSFRWPTVSRVTDPASAVGEAFLELCDGNGDLADWLIANQEVLVATYDTGKVKREVSPKAIEALALYREQQKAAKALAAEVEAANPEAVAEEEAERVAAGGKPKVKK
jgi:hypothetical protein